MWGGRRGCQLVVVGDPVGGDSVAAGEYIGGESSAAFGGSSGVPDMGGAVRGGDGGSGAARAVLLLHGPGGPSA